MLIKITSYKLGRQVHIEINKPYLFLYSKTDIIKFKILSKFWIKNLDNKNWSILFIEKYLIKHFITQLFTGYVLYKNLYFYKLRLKGLGFRIIKQAPGLFRFFFNKINYIYFYVPQNIIMEYKQRVLLFLSLNWDILKIIITHLLLLKRLAIYNTRGLMYPSQIRILKPGKKRF